MDYKNGKIYTLRSNQTDKFYIGSTTQSLSKRFYEQKKHYKQYLDGKKHYITSFDILQYEDAYIELLEEFPCENKIQLCKREGELIRCSNCVNKRIEDRTIKEWFEENKDKIKEYQKKYREQNKVNCECGGSYCGLSNRINHLKTNRHLNYLNNLS